MKISTKGRYGLRAMIELAIRYSKGPVMMSDIARNQGISRKYMHSLLTNLKAAGLVQSIRGSKGGYFLALPPSDISVSEVVEVLEGPYSPVGCVTDGTVCERSEQCVARDVWRDLGEAIKEALSGFTLEDLACRQEAKNIQPEMYYI